MMRRLIIPAAVLIIAVVLVTVALSGSVSPRNMTAEEQGLINQACIDCHYENGFNDSVPHTLIEGISCSKCHDNTHTLHEHADCIDCHEGTAGLETADRAHTIMQWVGFAAVLMLAVGLVVNFLIVQRKPGERGG